MQEAAGVEPRSGAGAVPLMQRVAVLAVLTVLSPRAAPRLLSVRGRHEGGQRRGPARHPQRQGGLAPRTGCGCLRRVPAAGRPQPEPPIPQPAAGGGGGAGAEGREGGEARRGGAVRSVRPSLRKVPSTCGGRPWVRRAAPFLGFPE